METVGPDGPGVSGGWIRKVFRVSDFVEPNDNIRVRFTAADQGAASIIEAGIDVLEVNVIDCAEAEILHGDVNLDGVVNLLDVFPFVEILSNNGFQAEADVNKDGVVNLLDTGPFVDLIAG